MQVNVVTDVGGDWIGLYKDDKLVHEGHSIDIRTGLEALGIEFESEEFDLERTGYAPPTWSGRQAWFDENAGDEDLG